ncbi:MAG: hypothetical protein JSV96_09550 [Candidatus Aminicenantes bacterium]|nr:MAG: hypothetical protein JSV96_09550 [Candidatus Aminicenantes bacterium]
MIKRISVKKKRSLRILALFFFLGPSVINLHFVQYGDWKTEVSETLGNKDYKGTIDLLLRNVKKDIPYPIVNGLLAYSYYKLKNTNGEYKWLQEYIETYRGTEFIFLFLDDQTFADVSDYMKTWKRKYPLITEIALIDSEIYKRFTPPDKIVLGIDIENPAYYKLYHGKKIIKGGLLNRGFNSLSIGAHELFKNSGSHVYLLDIKTEDLFLKKELEIDIQLDTQFATKKAEVRVRNIEYNLSLFIGDELIISSKKLHQEKLSWKFKIPAATTNLSPLIPPEKADPSKADYSLNSFSIPGAVAGILQLIEGLKKKESPEEKVSYFQKGKQLTTTFIRKNWEGINKEVKAVIRLKTRHLKIS